MNKLRQKTLSSLLKCSEFYKYLALHDPYGFYAALSQLIVGYRSF